MLVAVNYSANQGQCYVKLPFTDLRDQKWGLKDLLGDAEYEREGNDLHERGLYLDEPAWRVLVFSITSI
jgi:hypothetical protein